MVCPDPQRRRIADRQLRLRPVCIPTTQDGSELRCGGQSDRDAVSTPVQVGRGGLLGATREGRRGGVERSGCREAWCRRWDSNPQGLLRPGDFESPASVPFTPNPTSRATRSSYRRRRARACAPSAGIARSKYLPASRAHRLTLGQLDLGLSEHSDDLLCQVRLPRHVSSPGVGIVIQELDAFQGFSSPPLR